MFKSGKEKKIVQNFLFWICYAVKGEWCGGRIGTGIADDTSFRSAGGGMG
jgi:hypothetical protein